ALGELGQRRLALRGLVTLRGVAVFLRVALARLRLARAVDLEPARVLEDPTARAERVGRSPRGRRLDVDRGLVEDRVLHLARDEPIPDQLVELELLVLQVLSDGVGRVVERRRADGLVGVLRALL